jgi:polyisoprenoid-binding protein YceI
MKVIKTLSALVPLVILIGCAKNPAENVPAADVKSAGDAPKAASAAPAEGKTYAVATDASTIEFVGSKVTGSHKGGFKKFAGEFKVANGKIADTGNKVIIDTTSLWADNDRLAGHLKSPDFFNVAQFPTAIFESSSVTSGATNSTVTGNLTLHGVTKQITFPATIKVNDAAVEVAAEFFINRFDFEMKYAGKADDLIRKEVVLKLNVKAAPGKADFESLGKPAQTASLN